MISSEEFPVSVTFEASKDVLDSDSDSDFKVPTFEIAAFHKYKSADSDYFDQGPVKCNGKNFLAKNDDFYVNVYPDSQNTQDHVAHEKEMLRNVIKETEKKNIIAQPGFETVEKVPTFLSRRQSRKRGMKEKEKTKGFNWYNMHAPEMTEEKRNDLTVLKMRKALDPKHFYKRSALKTDADPKYFQVGTYVESPLDFYSSRVPKKQRKRTLVEELMADAEFRNYQKKKISEILQAQPKKFRHRKSFKKSKHKETRARNTNKQKK